MVRASVSNFGESVVKQAAWIVVILLFIMLQYQLWIGHDSVKETFHLKKAIAQSQQHNQALEKRNNHLIKRIMVLKSGKGMVEDLAREQMGMIKQNEEYYQFVGEPSQNNMSGDLKGK